MNVKKKKVMVFNFIDPCQKIVFEGDNIECVQTFKYLEIMLETTLNLDNVMEHLAIVSKCSLFTLNCHCAKLRIMDIKLRCDLFNTLVCSTTSYACEVWVDSNKIKTIEIMYRGFFKSLLGVRKTTSMSIVLVEFGKFPFEHFAWGQALLYYKHVNMVTKDCILGKAWESQLAMLVAEKKCWAGSVKKWFLKNQPQEVAGFLLPVQLACVLQVGIVQPPLRTVPRTMHVHPTHLARVRGWAKSQILWCNTQNVRVGARMVKLVALQLVQPVSTRSATKGSTNQEAEAPPPLGKPHIMLNVERVKDNMRLAFIEKFFTNRTIGTSV
jgi:hypothetical protein